MCFLILSQQPDGWSWLEAGSNSGKSVGRHIEPQCIHWPAWRRWWQSLCGLSFLRSMGCLLLQGWGTAMRYIESWRPVYIGGLCAIFFRECDWKTDMRIEGNCKYDEALPSATNTRKIIFRVQAPKRQEIFLSLFYIAGNCRRGTGRAARILYDACCVCR